MCLNTKEHQGLNKRLITSCCCFLTDQLQSHCNNILAYYGQIYRYTDCLLSMLSVFWEISPHQVSLICKSGNSRNPFPCLVPSQVQPCPGPQFSLFPISILIPGRRIIIISCCINHKRLWRHRIGNGTVFQVKFSLYMIADHQNN